MSTGMHEDGLDADVLAHFTRMGNRPAHGVVLLSAHSLFSHLSLCNPNATFNFGLL
jgi:hypothetical protein